MAAPISDLPNRLPRRLPVGATYVVEAYGGGEGNLRVVARYVLLPDGQRINLVSRAPRKRSSRTLAVHHATSAKRSRAKGRTAGAAKKFATR